MSDPAEPLSDWQRFTNDPEATNAPDRCGARSKGHGRPHDPDQCRTCAAEMGICLRRHGHPAGWHEGRSRQGNLVSWPTLDAQPGDLVAVGGAR